MDDQPAAEPLAPRWWRVLVRIARWPALGLIVAAIATLLAPWWWVGECASHWHLHLLLLCPLPALVLRQWWLWALMTCAAVFAAPLLVPEPASDSTAVELAAIPAVEVAVANTAWFNSREGAMTASLLAEDVAVLGVVELTAALDVQLAAAYPYRHAVTDVGLGAFGIGCYSRLPIIRAARHDIGWSVVLELDLAVAGGPVRLLLAHPPPPVGADGFALRDQILDAVARLAAGSPHPVIAMGDFNCSPGSPAWRRLLRAGNLRASGGILRTWPSAFAQVGLAIDHILTGPGLRADDLERFVIPGSDHRGLRATIVAADGG